MAALQNFRSALNGFNREDVVHYIEYLNNTHSSEIGQLNTELQQLHTQLKELQNQPKEDNSALIAELEESNARRASLEQEIQALREELASAQQAADHTQTDAELEAYRRAERAERLASERVSQLYHQANGVLADSTVRVDEAATQVSGLVDQATVLLAQLQNAVLASRNSLKDAAAAMYSVRPIQNEE